MFSTQIRQSSSIIRPFINHNLYNSSNLLPITSFFLKSNKFSTTSHLKSDINVAPAPPGVPHYLTHADLSAKEIYNLLTLAIQHKYNVKYLNKGSGAPLAGKTLAVMFSKRSTRTRVATESAVAYLGNLISIFTIL
jgi:hypothetical protein